MIPFPLHLEILQPQTRAMSSIDHELAAIHARRARRPQRQPLLKRYALRRLFGGGHVIASTGEITIRRATAADHAALARLAELDQQPLLRGTTLVAEVDRRIVAGVSLAATAEPVADPFRARRDVVQLLQVRAAQLAA